MKKFYLLLYIIFISTTLAFAQTVNGRILVVENTNTTYSVKIQIAVQSGTYNLGNADIRLLYNPSALSFPLNPVNNTDYVFNNFNGNEYSSTVSTSSPDTISINISNLTNQGAAVTTNYIDIATINFQVVNSSISYNLVPVLREFFTPLSHTIWSIGNWTTSSSVPPAPALASPSNGATNQPLTVTLKWNASSGASSYQLQVATDNNFSNLVYNKAGLTSTSQTVSSLAYNQAYYWHVNASNSAGTSSYSSAWNFTTESSAPVSGTGVKLNAVVILSGSYKGKSMQTDLNNLGYLPNSQPYNSAPWNYDGKESVKKFSSDIVDWVLVELRSSTSSSSTVGRRAALLKSDGTVVDLDGTSPLQFSSVSDGSYYIVIRHRNHLAIMSANKVNLSSTSTTYDFTTSESKAYGSLPMDKLGGNLYGLYSGDANADGTVSVDDQNNIWLTEFLNSKDGYNPADFNLDGTVTASDNNIYWKKDVGISSQVPN